MNSSGTWDAYNDLLLRGPLDRFTKMWARYELFKQVIDLPGDIVEGGVFKGAGLLYWRLAALHIAEFQKIRLIARQGMRRHSCGGRRDRRDRWRRGRLHGGRGYDAARQGGYRKGGRNGANSGSNLARGQD